MPTENWIVLFIVLGAMVAFALVTAWLSSKRHKGPEGGRREAH